MFHFNIEYEFNFIYCHAMNFQIAGIRALI